VPAADGFLLGLAKLSPNYMALQHRTLYSSQSLPQEPEIQKGKVDYFSPITI
jgi:hypothetical protein